MPGNRCSCCGETVLGGSFKAMPIVSEPEPVIEKVHLPGQLHPIGGDPRVWTPKTPKTGGRIKQEKEVRHLLKQLGYDSDSGSDSDSDTETKQKKTKKN